MWGRLFWGSRKGAVSAAGLWNFSPARLGSCAGSRVSSSLLLTSTGQIVTYSGRPVINLLTTSRTELARVRQMDFFKYLMKSKAAAERNYRFPLKTLNTFHSTVVGPRLFKLRFVVFWSLKRTGIFFLSLYLGRCSSKRIKVNKKGLILKRFLIKRLVAVTSVNNELW